MKPITTVATIAMLLAGVSLASAQGSTDKQIRDEKNPAAATSSTHMSDDADTNTPAARGQVKAPAAMKSSTDAQLKDEKNPASARSATQLTGDSDANKAAANKRAARNRASTTGMGSRSGTDVQINEEKNPSAPDSRGHLTGDSEPRGRDTPK